MFIIILIGYIREIYCHKKILIMHPCDLLLSKKKILNYLLRKNLTVLGKKKLF